MNDFDDAGNTTATFEDTVAGITDIFMDGVEESKSPEKPTEQQAEAAPEADEDIDDELSSIVDELSDDEDDEAGNPENSDETDEAEEEQEEGDDPSHIVKIDGEEHTVSLSELKKGYGLQQSLTRKGQELAEMREKLDAEAQAVAWVKAQPEARKLAEDIQEAQEAVSRGFVFDENGNQVRLTQAQVEQTQQNIADAQAKMTEMAKPPRLDELYEAIPALKDPASEEAQAVLKPFGEALAEFGYSQPEIAALNDPRTFLMLKELHELRDLQSRVNKAKAKRGEKKPVSASKVTKSAKPAGSSKNSGTASNKPKVTIEQVYAGDASPADLFMED